MVKGGIKGIGRIEVRRTEERAGMRELWRREEYER